MTSNRGRTAALTFLIFGVLVTVLLLVLPLVPLRPLMHVAEEELRFQTGREVEIGSAYVSLAGGPGIRLQNVSIAAGEVEGISRLFIGNGDGDRRFFVAEEVRVRLEILPLASLRVRPRSVMIESPVIYVGRTTHLLSIADIIDWITGLDEAADEYRLPPIERLLALDGRVLIADEGLLPETFRLDIEELRFEAVDIVPGRTSRFAVVGRVFGGEIGSLRGGGTFGPIDEDVAFTRTPVGGQIVLSDPPRWLALALTREWSDESPAIVIDFSGTIADLSASYSLACAERDGFHIGFSGTAADDDR